MESEKVWIFEDFVPKKARLFWNLCYNGSMIKRQIEPIIRDYLKKDKKIIAIFGARQVGKTTVLKEIFNEDDESIVWYNGDEDETKRLFSKANLVDLAPLVKGYRTVIIDEAQKINNIGTKLKILQDNLGNDIQFIATGSSSFDLANKINEPLTGRKRTIKMFPFSLRELVDNHGYMTEISNLDNRLIYGLYPAVVSKIEEAKNIVLELASENLYRDILNLGNIIKTDKLEMILRVLAMQVGNQVSMNEIGQLVGLDSKTVEKYIALLEQSYIIFRLPSFGRNLRNELKFSQKIFFYDCGIRNAIIGDFRSVDMRQDIGSLFENFIISELKKRLPNDNVYFWRNKNQQEVDYLIEKNGEITAIEIKWNLKKSTRMPNIFLETYKPKNTIFIDRNNYLEIFTGDKLNDLD